MYAIADGDKVTLVDCGVWRPDTADGGLQALEARPARAPATRCATSPGSW